MNTVTITRHREDQLVKHSEFCGEIRELLQNDYPTLAIAIAVDIGSTVPHFHRTFDEIYFVVEGDLTLHLYDPATARTSTEHLGENELCLIPKGVHHAITSASRRNRLCAITAPPFVPGDEIRSDVLPNRRT